MTAEVAIMNKWAVALSADSAVTTGSPGEVKIFNGANKLFTLSKYAPVGIMIYGHVEHFGIPWDTIIKDYRNYLKRKRFACLSDYVEDFKKYVCSDHIITDHQQELGVLIGCAHTSGSILSAVLAESSGKRVTVRMINDAIKKRDEELAKIEILDAYVDYTYATFSRKYSLILDSYIKEDPFGTVHIPRSCATSFKKLVWHYMISKMRTGFSTGIVIAGFGDSELFPKMFHFTADGGVDGRLRIMDSDPVDIGRSGETVHVEAFAQDDAVEAFMNGVDERYEAYATSMFKGFMVSHTREVLNEHTQLSDDEKETIISMVKKNFENSATMFQDELLSYSVNNFRLPIIDVLRNAPKDELAHVAESLVNLTSLKRRVTGEPETVGGPIDVAVISKGDGFVWIKRKHYFQPELNHHFTRNYFDHGDENDHQRKASD